MRALEASSCTAEGASELLLRPASGFAQSGSRIEGHVCGGGQNTLMEKESQDEVATIAWRTRAQEDGREARRLENREVGEWDEDSLR